MPVETIVAKSSAPAAVEAPPAAQPAAGSPLDEPQFVLVQEAARNYKPIKRAAWTALSSAVLTLVIGITALPLALIWPSPAGVMIVVGLCAVGVVEFLGYRKMRRADPAAAVLLARNQLAFLGVIVFYCVLQMLSFSVDDAKAAALSPETRAQLNIMPEMARAIDRDIERWAPIVTYGFYSLVVVLSVFCQGGMALYYNTRRKYLETFNRQTPPWVRRLLVEFARQ
jgi:hypothetical protein